MCIKYKKIKKNCIVASFPPALCYLKKRPRLTFFPLTFYLFIYLFLERLVDKTVDLIKVQNTTPEKFSWVAGTLRLYFLNKSALN